MKRRVDREAPRLDARCVRRETDAGIEFATRMDDADMAVEGGAVARHGAERLTSCRRFAVIVLKYPWELARCWRA